MGFLDDIFDSGASGVSGVSTQIVSTHSQLIENEYGLSGSTRHSRPKCHSISSAENPEGLVESSHHCGDCQHFERDDINPSYGLGDCRMFLLPDGRRQIVRYPMERPKNKTCFKRGMS